MLLSIIIVNFRTFEMTCNCIRSIKQHVADELQCQIILIDNAPLENKENEFILEFPGIVYLKTTENIGFSRANNMGIAYAEGNYILLLNSDTIVFDNSIQRCTQFMENDTMQAIGVLGCKLLNEDGSFQTSYYPFQRNTILNYLLANNIVLSKVLNINARFQISDRILEVGDVSGAFMLIRKQVIEEVAGFDPDFFLYAEETEWCRERIKKRYKIVYYPFAAIIHIGGKSAPKEEMLIQARISQALVWYKKGWVNYILYCIFYLLNTLLNLLTFPFVKKTTQNVILSDIKSAVKAFPYFLKDVISYKNSFGSRTKPLVYRGARTIFFG